MNGNYNEDELVQRTMADYLKQELGWRLVHAYNQEDFGQDSLLGRGQLIKRPLVLVYILFSMRAKVVVAVLERVKRDCVVLVVAHHGKAGRSVMDSTSRCLSILPGQDVCYTAIFVRGPKSPSRPTVSFFAERVVVYDEINRFNLSVDFFVVWLIL